MQRRDFLRNSLGSALTLGALSQLGHPSALSAAQQPVSPEAIPAKAKGNSLDIGKIRGVNLGGWLVLESWMLPGLYGDSGAPDEYSLCQAWGSQAEARLTRHRETFVTAEDFRWIAQRGLNAVRLPVGYWTFEKAAPFVEGARFVDFALEQARLNGLQLLIDLHGAQGSQNGWDHSGRSGQKLWHTERRNIAASLDTLEHIAERYGKHPALLGIQLLNEPHKEVPLEILKAFYLEAYPRLSRHLRPGAGLFMHDGFRPLDWAGFEAGEGFRNVILDTHCYQCFSEEDKARSLPGHMQHALNRRTMLAEMEGKALPCIVGEWSLGLPGRHKREASAYENDLLLRAYAANQLLSFESCRGWFFWSYKLEKPSPWHFRHCVEQGWLPGSFA